MAISPAVLHELKHELTHLRQCRQQIDQEIHGIERILSMPRVPAGESGRKTRKHGRAVRAALAQANGSAPRVSLRTQVMEVLQQAPGSKAARVTELLNGQGFRVGGVTSLSKRVALELSRLRSIGVVRKRRGGRYVIAATPRDNEPPMRRSLLPATSEAAAETLS